MKKVIFVPLLLLFILAGCRTFPVPEEVASGTTDMYDTVNSQKSNYEYQQKSKDYSYVEDYNASNRSYDVTYTSSSSEGTLIINYTSYLDKDDTDNLKVTINGKESNESFTDEQLAQIVKPGSELFKIHSEFLKTYSDNFSKDLKYKNVSETDSSYVIEGKSNDKNDLYIEMDKDLNNFRVVDQTRETEQQIILK